MLSVGLPAVLGELDDGKVDGDQLAGDQRPEMEWTVAEQDKL